MNKKEETIVKEKKQMETKGLNFLGPKEEEIKQMAECGLYFGHKKTLTHPSMKPFIFTFKDNVYIIDLEKTYEKLNQALEVLKDLYGKGSLILFVGTRPHLKEPIKKIAEIFKMPYIVENWIGGLITNFEEVSKRIKKYLETKEKFEKGEFSHYPKKEVNKIEKDLKKMEAKWGTLVKLIKIPDLVFIFDLKNNRTCVNECRRKRVKIMALADTDSDVSNIDYVIPANDDSLKGINYIISKMEKILPEKSY